ncbi:hypothetical protein ACHAXT_005774 [Thalassiosira profunda]
MSDQAGEGTAPTSGAASLPPSAASLPETASAGRGVTGGGGAMSAVGAPAIPNSTDAAAPAVAAAAPNPQLQAPPQLGGAPVAGQPLPPYQIHPALLTQLMLDPQLQQQQMQQMTPEQHRMALMQQQLVLQQMAQQQLLQLQQANIQPPSGMTQNSTEGEAAAQWAILQQQVVQHALQQQMHQAAQFQAAVAAAVNGLPQQPSFQPGLFQVGASQQQIPIPQPPQSIQQAAYAQPVLDPLHGIPVEGIQAIYQADESNLATNQYDSDDDGEGGLGDRPLIRLVEDHHWVAALQRIATHPRETQQVGIQGRTPLHVACDHDAPPALVQALLNAWPEGAERVGTSQMNPLHITCSSPHASVDVVRVLLQGCRDSLRITGAKDVDGDTPLHAACRCAAPMDVLVTLLQANPTAVTQKDYEGLNPLMRLWVRYFVLVGEQIISNIAQPSDINGELIEAWQKSLLLLQVMHGMENPSSEHNQSAPFRTVHAASSVDCPRCVLRIARVLFPQELLSRDEKNQLPVHIAAAAPVYAVHDLRGEGYTIDDVDFDEDPAARVERNKKKECKYKEPSVLNILLDGEPAAARERDAHGQLPLHVAIMRGKTLDEGVQALVDAHPDALTQPDSQTNLYPFMLAASVGRGRGHVGTIFALLRDAPDLVTMALTGEPPDDEEMDDKADDRKPAAVEMPSDSKTDDS